MTRFLGLIFDFNGVLWWDGALQEESWNEFAVAVRGEPFSAAEMAAQVHGRNMGHTLEYLTQRSLTAREVEQLAETKEVVYRRLCLAQGAGFCLSPGAVELLDWLVERGIPHTIATASRWPNVSFFIERLGLGDWFEVAQIVFDDGTRPGKPAPDIYVEAARRLGLPPGRCVVVEDSRSGLAAARAAGVGCLVALTTTHAEAELAQLPGVDLLLPDLSALLPGTLFACPGKPSNPGGERSVKPGSGTTER